MWAKSGSPTKCASRVTVSQAIATNTMKRNEDITTTIEKRAREEERKTNRLTMHTLAKQDRLAAVCIVEGVFIEDPWDEGKIRRERGHCKRGE